jgi:hypothetical protein
MLLNVSASNERIALMRLQESCLTEACRREREIDSIAFSLQSDQLNEFSQLDRANRMRAISLTPFEPVSSVNFDCP